jgi:hypothetical protein
MSEIDELVKEKKRITRIISKHSNKLFEIIEKIKNICPHTDVETTYSSREAGFDYVAEYYTIKKCKICGETKTTTKFGSSYG